MQQLKRKNTNSKRRGFLTMELVFVLPIFLIVLFAIFEFSLLLFARGSLAEATRTGCRVACMPGSTQQDVENAVYSVVGTRIAGNMSINVELGRSSGDVVEVGIRVPMNTISPDLLWPIGYSLRERHLYQSARMLRE